MVHNTTSAHAVRIATGRREVSPSHLPVAIVQTPVANSVAEPLEINAALFTAGDITVLLASFDLLYIGGKLEQEIRSALQARHGLADKNVLLFASHTHSAPQIDAELFMLGRYEEAYSNQVRDAFLELVDELARRDTRPLRIEVRRGSLHHAVNRRRPRHLPIVTRHGLRWDRVSFAPFAAGPHNEAVTVVTMRDAETDKPLALLWHYACHAVSHAPRHSVSSDFPGVTREVLRKEHGTGLPVFFLQGFCGDVRPNVKPDVPKSPRQKVHGFVMQALRGVLNLEVTPESWLRWAISLAEGVAGVAASRPDAVETPQGIAAARADLPLDRIFSGQTRNSTLVLRGLRLGSAIEVIGFGAEVVTDWADVINKTCLPAKGRRLLTGYCGNVFGYLPIARHLREGGYETVDFQPHFRMNGRYCRETLEPAVCETVADLMQRLAGSNGYP